jgi:plastocyanin
MKSLMKAMTVLFLGMVSVFAVSCGPGDPGSTQVTNQTTTPSASVSQLNVTIFTDTNGFFGFSPKTLAIPVGTTVTWKNSTPVAHTVTSDEGTSFDSGIIPAGGSYKFTFTRAGSFAYHCNIHPYMKATIIVT